MRGGENLKKEGEQKERSTLPMHEERRGGGKGEIPLSSSSQFREERKFLRGGPDLFSEGGDLLLAEKEKGDRQKRGREWRKEEGLAPF